MFSELDASGYSYSATFYNNEFEDLLSKIILCYQLMLKNKEVLINDENRIRDVILINYLKNNAIRTKFGINNYLFDREVPEDKSQGRTDIKIITANTFQDTEAYYIIECKRLDSNNTSGQTGLNAEYIKNGISRFVSNYYSSHYRTNGMIGFIISPLDINENVSSINLLLKTLFTQINTKQELRFREIMKDFNFSYFSIHSLKSKDIVLYHLMLDFSKNIK